MDKHISRLGFGAWQLGNADDWGQMEEKEAVALVQTAYGSGVTFFDTAPNYALGLRETFLGKAVEGFRDKVFISSKYGHDAEGGLHFGIDGIERSLRGSLKRLNTTYLDALLLHNPPLDVLKGKQGHFRELARLKELGLIRAYGASVDTKDEVEAVLSNSGIGAIELLYNVFFQATRPLLREINRRGIILIIKVPLDSGWLTGKYGLGSTFGGIRSRWTPEVIARRADLVAKLEGITKDRSLAKYALGFLWSYPEITTVIPGIRNLAQLDDHLAAEGDTGFICVRQIPGRL